MKLLDAIKRVYISSKVAFYKAVDYPKVRITRNRNGYFTQVAATAVSGWDYVAPDGETWMSTQYVNKYCRYSTLEEADAAAIKIKKMYSQYGVVKVL